MEFSSVNPNNNPAKSHQPNPQQQQQAAQQFSAVFSQAMGKVPAHLVPPSEDVKKQQLREKKDQVEDGAYMTEEDEDLSGYQTIARLKQKLLKLEQEVKKLDGNISQADFEKIKKIKEKLQQLSKKEINAFLSARPTIINPDPPKKDPSGS